jgi:activator of HSP90 ATPase
VDRKLKLVDTFKVDPQTLYSDWLSSAGHSAFTFSQAQIDPKPGGKFTAWDGYIWGVTLELEPARRIVQSWRTSEFPEDAPDSRLELTLERVNSGTKFTICHSNIPDGQADGYEVGWEDYYFKPMREYYG